MPRLTTTDRLELAQEMLEAGFTSEAARKRALDQVSYAFEYGVAADLRARLLANRDTSTDYNLTAEDSALYYDFPSYPHAYTAKMAVRTQARFPDLHVQAQSMKDLRDAIKAVEIVKVERPAQVERVETIRKSILEIMEQRHAQYIEAVEIGRMFNGLPVSVNAHYVHGHKGAFFIRHFFYLAGKLTALQVIMAAADTLQREKEAAAL